jgi:hypothetical protein
LIRFDCQEAYYLPFITTFRADCNEGVSFPFRERLSQSHEGNIRSQCVSGVRIEDFLNNAQTKEKRGRISYQIDMIKIQHWISRRTGISQSHALEFSLWFWNIQRENGGERQKIVLWHCASNADWNIESRQNRILDPSRRTIFAHEIRSYEYPYLSDEEDIGSIFRSAEI